MVCASGSHERPRWCKAWSSRPLPTRFTRWPAHAPSRSSMASSDVSNPEKRASHAIAFGGGNILAALVVALGVFRGLPARYWPVDVGALAVVALLTLSGVGLVLRRPWGERVARIAASIVLAVGLVFV